MLNIHHHRYQTQCIMLLENYDQSLEREERQQLIPIKEESAVKESLDSITCNYSQSLQLIHTMINTNN